MKVIIIGAGEVGTGLAETLCLEKNAVVVVDKATTLLNDLANKFDLMIVSGNGASASILLKAGVKDAQLMVSVTQSNEVNVLAERPLVTPIVSDFVDVSGFSTFRVYTRTTSQSGSGTLVFRVTESVDGIVDARPGATGGLGHTLSGFLPDVSPFDMTHNVASHPRRYLGVEVLSNDSGDAHTFSVFLYAAP